MSGTSDLSARRAAQLHKDLDRFGIQDKALRATLVKADIILVELLAGKPLQDGVEMLIMDDVDRSRPN